MALIVSTSITRGETSAQQKTNPKELLFPGELFTGPCWDALWSVSHVKEQQSPVPTLPVPPGPHGTDPVLQPRHPKEPLPSLDLPGPKADSFPPEGCFHCFPRKGAHKCHQPLPRPQQLQLPQPGLAGDGECSWHRGSTPELAFGYQPWVWFEILPENVTTSSGRALLPQTLEKSPATNPSVPCRSSAHLPGEAQAAAP